MWKRLQKKLPGELLILAKICGFSLTKRCFYGILIIVIFNSKYMENASMASKAEEARKFAEQQRAHAKIAADLRNQPKARVITGEGQHEITEEELAALGGLEETNRGEKESNEDVGIAA